MDLPWQTVTPIERQAAAAELWMELTGRTKVAKFELVEEAKLELDKVADAQSELKKLDSELEKMPYPPSKKPSKPHKGVAAVAGASLGAVPGGLAGYMAAGPKASKLKGRLGAAAGAAAGTALAGKALYDAGKRDNKKLHKAELKRFEPHRKRYDEIHARRDELIDKLHPPKGKEAAASMEKVPGTGPNHPPHPGHVPGDKPPKLRHYAGAGAAAGGLAGAAGARRAAKGVKLFTGKAIGPARQIAEKGFRQAASKKQVIRQATVGGGAAGAGLGAAVGLGVGIHKLKKHLEKKQEKQAEDLLVLGTDGRAVLFEGLAPLFKEADAKTKAIGAAGGALTLGGAGALKSYLDHKPGKDGKSKAEMREEQELERLHALFKNQGKDMKNLPGMAKMKKRYGELRHEQASKAKESPGRSAAKQSVPWALGGAAVGAHLAPKASKVLGRLK